MSTDSGPTRCSWKSPGFATWSSEHASCHTRGQSRSCSSVPRIARGDVIAATCGNRPIGRRARHASADEAAPFGSTGVHTCPYASARQPTLGETECGCVGCVLATALVRRSSLRAVAVAAAVSDGGSGLGGSTHHDARPRHSERVQDRDARRAPRSASPPKTITVTVVADVNNSHPARPVPGLVGRREGVGRLHERQGRPRVPQGRREGGRLQAEPDRRDERDRRRVRRLGRAGRHHRAVPRRTSARWTACKDKAGAATGIPDLAELQTEAAQQCSPISFATLPGRRRRARTAARGPRTFHVGYTQYDYYFKKYGADALHGVFVIPKDLPSTIAATMPIFRAENKMGIKSDAEFGKSGTAIQTDYTAGRAGDEVAQLDVRPQRPRLQGHRARCARKRRRRASTPVKVWDCSVQCYDQRLIQRGRRRGRRPVRVAELPAVRGQGRERRARRVPAVRQEARRLRRAGVGRGRDLRPARSTTRSRPTTAIPTRSPGPTC